jgi:hypothetical protein
MRKYFICTMVLASTLPTIAGENAQDLIKIFDSVCVGSAATPAKIRAAVDLFNETPPWHPMPVTAEIQKQLEMSGVGQAQRRDYGIIKEDVATNSEDSFYLVTASEKHVNGVTSNSCSITVKYLDVANVKVELEKLYKISKVLEERQGMSLVSIYLAHLIGLPTNKYSISIQEDVTPDKPSDMFTLSLFER